MNNQLKTSFIRFLLLFYLSLSFLLALIFYFNFKENINNVNKDILNKMEICNLNFKCNEKIFRIDVVKNKNNLKTHYLFITENNVKSYFEVKDTNYTVVIEMFSKEYKIVKDNIFKNNIKSFLFFDFFLFLFSFAFSYMTLLPLKKSFQLNEEFIKDFLHDINTPLSSMKLNLSILKKKINFENKNIKRIENNILSIQNLQLHLKSFIYNLNEETTNINLFETIINATSIMEKSYNNINLIIEDDIKKVNIYTHKESFYRIVFNIVSNAFKYNLNDNGIINIYMENHLLIIKDNGIGIKNVNKIFDRYYKENERGIGIGLNIVSKLSKELDIGISVESEYKNGTKFILNLKKIMVTKKLQK